MMVMITAAIASSAVAGKKSPRIVEDRSSCCWRDSPVSSYKIFHVIEVLNVKWIIQMISSY